MYLIRLTANKPSFHTIEFKEGLNFIIGGVQDKKDKQNKTYNGVGKSLIIKIIHFCLGCDTVKSFEDKLKDWEFSLEFRIDRDEYAVTRNCLKQKNIKLNGKELTLSEYKNWLGNKLFNLNRYDMKYLTYRSLISRFIRPSKYSYDYYDKFVFKEKEYSQNICNSYLLGLDVNLVNTKRELVENKRKLTDAKNIFEKDDTIKTFFEKDEKIDVSIIDLEQNIIKLKDEIEKFKIADNYYEIEKEANTQQNELNKLENEIVMLENAIKNINDSLDVHMDISTYKVIEMYNEAKVKLSEMVIKELQEVEEFHKTLIENRTKRLLKQKQDLLKKEKEKQKIRNSVARDYDKNMKLLGAYGALEEYNALNNKLSQYYSRLEKLNSYKELLENYRNEITNINIALEQQNKETNEYLRMSKDIKERNILVFRELVQRFYPNKKGGIQIENDEGEGLNRFKISASIEDDTSDGVNGVKIFSYDYTMMVNGFNHSVRFLFHDSRLFSDIDPRQKTECIKIAQEFTEKYGFQYIATLNEDFLDTIKGTLEEKEYREIEDIIHNNTVLRLTDKEAEGKLLGMQIDLKYEEN